MKAFISYPREQEMVARQLHDICSEIGVDAFFDKEKLSGGDLWEYELVTRV